MEYLVTMTTTVPAGTPEEAIAEVVARELAHTHLLARQGKVLRLWRPPLQPGEWRSIGLFSASDSADLESILSGMPLRVWRTDEATPLANHPNDPGRMRTPLTPGWTEFLTTLTVTIPPGTSPDTTNAMMEREATRTRELAEQGNLVRLWLLPGRGRNLGHWQASNDLTLHDALRSLPMADWLDIETVHLSAHPSDPGTGESRPGHLNGATTVRHDR